MSYAINVVELRKAMVDAGIFTIGELSRVSNVNRNTVSRVVNDGYKPSTAVMEKIAAALNLDASRAGIIFFMPVLRKS